MRARNPTGSRKACCAEEGHLGAVGAEEGRRGNGHVKHVAEGLVDALHGALLILEEQAAREVGHERLEARRLLGEALLGGAACVVRVAGLDGGAAGGEHRIEKGAERGAIAAGAIGDADDAHHAPAAKHREAEKRSQRRVPRRAAAGARVGGRVVRDHHLAGDEHRAEEGVVIAKRHAVDGRVGVGASARVVPRDVGEGVRAHEERAALVGLDLGDEAVLAPCEGEQLAQESREELRGPRVDEKVLQERGEARHELQTLLVGRRRRWEGLHAKPLCWWVVWGSNPGPTD
jgi:hypothetical protein